MQIEKINLIIVPSHGRTMLLAKVVFAITSIWQIWSRYRVQSWTPTSPSTMFGSSTVTLWILLSKVYGVMITTSTVRIYKKDFQVLQRSWKHKAKLSHSIVKVVSVPDLIRAAIASSIPPWKRSPPWLGLVPRLSWRSLIHTEVYKFFRYRNILINAALRSHRTLSNSEAGPRIWTCVTRPSRARMFVGSGHETSQTKP